MKHEPLEYLKYTLFCFGYSDMSFIVFQITGNSNGSFRLTTKES